MEPRVWTVDEANAAIPRLRGLLEQTRELESDRRETMDHLRDLRIVYGLQLDDRRCEAHGEWEALKRRHRDQAEALDRDLDAYKAMGVVIKDIDQGLFDFYTRLGSRFVFLCWRSDEEQVAHWHELDAGFPGRRPLGDYAGTMSTGLSV